MKKKFQLAILGILLVAVIAGGVWFLTGGPNKRPDSTGTPDSGADFDWLNAENVCYRVLNETERDLTVPFGRGVGSYITSPKFYLFQSQVCQFTVDGEGEDAVLQLVSVYDGSVLKSYDPSCFSDFFQAYYLDSEEQLWTIQNYVDGDSKFYQLCRCEPKKEAVKEVLDMQDAAGHYFNPEEYNPYEFALWENFVVVLSCREATDSLTGDVGDIQMILGAGLDQSVITDTDAFTDLTPYLDACPFRDELELNLLEPLRDAGGAVRALPLAIQPQYAIYNMTLLEELGNPVDPDNATWSELLDLALQWKEEGTDLSLTSCSPGAVDNAREVLLQRLLLANLYDAEQADGTVQLDQPYLRELLVKLKSLWNDRQLIREDGNHIRDGFFQKSLYVYGDRPVCFTGTRCCPRAIFENARPVRLQDRTGKKIGRLAYT